jgi:hypothetical protein
MALKKEVTAALLFSSVSNPLQPSLSAVSGVVDYASPRGVTKDSQDTHTHRNTNPKLFPLTHPRIPDQRPRDHG